MVDALKDWVTARAQEQGISFDDDAVRGFIVPQFDRYMRRNHDLIIPVARRRRRGRS